MLPTLKAELPLHVDSTMINCFRSCGVKFRNEFVYGLRPPGLSIDLHAGACFATGIEITSRGVWEKQLSLSDALERGHAAFAVAWGDFEIPPHKVTGKTFDNVWNAVVEYFKKWPPLTDTIQPYVAADGKATFEYTFAIPLEPCCEPKDYTFAKLQENASWGGADPFPCHPSGGPFVYSGRFDLLGNYLGKPTPRDEKTSGKTPGANWSESWDLRSQFMGYVWACQQAGLDTDSVLVRGCPILKTKQDGQVEAHKTYPRHLIDRWYEQLRRDLWRIRRSWDEGYFDYNLSDSCTSYGNCVFLTPCTAPTEHQESWLSAYEVRRWNPLLKNPTKDPVV